MDELQTFLKTANDLAVKHHELQVAYDINLKLLEDCQKDYKGLVNAVELFFCNAKTDQLLEHECCRTDCCYEDPSDCCYGDPLETLHGASLKSPRDVVAVLLELDPTRLKWDTTNAQD